MTQTKQDRFRGVIGAVLGIDSADVIDALTHEQVDTWDSLNHINIISALEQEFGVTLPADSMAGHQSVQGLRTLLASHGVVL